MPRNEDGEMELVLGNRQLLSVLFILVVLLGVFFTMGYIVGRNNPSEEKLRYAAAKAQVASAAKMPPLTVDPSGGVKPKPTSVEPERARTPVTIDPGRTEPSKPETAKKEEIKKKEEPPKKEEKKEAKKEQKKEPEKVPVVVEAGGPIYKVTPAAGMYLQVAAIDRPA